jgi:hypothetical protein
LIRPALRIAHRSQSIGRCADADHHGDKYSEE